MKSVVICGREAANYDQYTAVRTIKIDEKPVTVGLIETLQPDFSPFKPENRLRVFIKIRAFSCNYSDKSIIFAIHQKCGDGVCYSCIGSEFVGEIIAIGTSVSKFQIGDRVIGNNQFPHQGASDHLQGLPTTSASRRYWAIHETKLLKVPSTMSDIVAAGFSIGAQTSYSMLRRLQIQAGKNVLITATTSNTSLFVINALKKYAVNIYAITTKASDQNRHKLMQMGVKEVIPIATTLLSLRENQRIEEIMIQTGGFDYVIDPFFELYLSKVLYSITLEGKYITCGRGDMYPQLMEQTTYPKNRSLLELMLYTSVHNIQLMGNSLGQAKDLLQAMEDYNAGLLQVTIDSVFSKNQVAALLERTFNAQDRFGKVVYCYND